MQATKLKFPDDFDQVCDLLQKTMRPKNLNYPIHQEYPIVLAPQSGGFSYGLKASGKVLAHLNLWPRAFTSLDGHTKVQVGLVGNVATHPDWQGRGLMKRLFTFLEELAHQHHLAALILWSDLDEFYHGLGFQSLGQEWLFKVKTQPKVDRSTWDVAFPKPCDLSSTDFDRMLSLRPQVAATLIRSSAEFARMLSIPFCDLCTLSQNGIIYAFSVLGKGYDMEGVIHEWGGVSPNAVTSCFNRLAQQLSLKYFYVLSPYNLKSEWLGEFGNLAVEKSILDMAWIKAIDLSRPQMELLDQSFIWGLDSI